MMTQVVLGALFGATLVAAALTFTRHAPLAIASVAFSYSEKELAVLESLVKEPGRWKIHHTQFWLRLPLQRDDKVQIWQSLPDEKPVIIMFGYDGTRLNIYGPRRGPFLNAMESIYNNHQD